MKTFAIFVEDSSGITLEETFGRLDDAIEWWREWKTDDCFKGCTYWITEIHASGKMDEGT